MRKTPDAMIFDVDGTLFQTESILQYAYEQTFQLLREKGLYTGPVPPIEKMYQTLGMVIDDIWNELLPDVSDEVKDAASEAILTYEIAGLKQGKGKLYPGVKETLEKLAGKGIRLFVASNGLEPYVKEIVSACGLAHLIEYAYSAGEFQTTSKSDLVRILLEEHQLTDAWMVGDRSSDIQAAKDNQLVAVGCDYARFKKEGELDQADIMIKRFSDLLQYVE